MDDGMADPRANSDLRILSVCIFLVATYVTRHRRPVVQRCFITSQYDCITDPARERHVDGSPLSCAKTQ